MKRIAILTAAVLAATLGCGDLGENRRDASGSAGGAGLVGIETEPAPAAPLPGAAVGEQPPPPQPAGAQAPAPAAPAPQPEMVRERATAGVTGKGDYEPGLITTPISAYFSVRERIVFDIQIPHAMNLYEATNGYKPKSQEVFMKEIIEFNQIELPALPIGHRYVYEPATGELLVEHPG
ncbi:MAG: hypothetical protein WD403_16115 [Pirellulales bacterium]